MPRPPPLARRTLKLSSLKPRLTEVAPRIARHTDSEGHSRALEPWRPWYNSAEWKALRLRVFARDRYVCQCGCGTFIAKPIERIADHKTPHRGDRDLFFDPENVWTLWKPHHDGWKQRLERRGGALGRG